MKETPENNINLGTKHKIILSYNFLIDTFRDYINEDGGVKSLERGLIADDGTTIFEDYFENTHDMLREKHNLNESTAITKINLTSGKSILIATQFQKSLRGKNIKFLDLIKESLHPSMKKILDDQLLKIHNIEHMHFNNKRKIKDKTAQYIAKTLN